MRVWIDNTGLQSAALCLAGRANPSSDVGVRGLLQLATLIIFCKKISLNGFEEEAFANRSLMACQQLKEAGIDSDVLSIIPINREEYSLACRSAAVDVSAKLSVLFSCDSVSPEERSESYWANHSELVPASQFDLLFESETSQKLSSASATALDNKASGAISYMLAEVPELRMAIRKAFWDRTQWNHVARRMVATMLRFHLNQALSEFQSSKYTPAVARAAILKESDDFLLSRLFSKLDEVTAEFRGEALAVPSVIESLLQRSKGEPIALLKVARELRELAAPLHEELDAIAQAHASDTWQGRWSINEKVREMGAQLRRNLTKGEGRSLADALELRFIFGLPAPSISGKKIFDWLRENQRAKKTAVLSELVRSAALPFSPLTYSERLRRASTEKWKMS